MHDNVYAAVLVALCTAGGGGGDLVHVTAAAAAACVLRSHYVMMDVFVCMFLLTSWLMVRVAWSSVGAMGSPTAAAAPCTARCCSHDRVPSSAASEDVVVD